MSLGDWWHLHITESALRTRDLNSLPVLPGSCSLQVALGYMILLIVLQVYMNERKESL